MKCDVSSKLPSITKSLAFALIILAITFAIIILRKRAILPPHFDQMLHETSSVGMIRYAPYANSACTKLISDDSENRIRAVRNFVREAQSASIAVEVVYHSHGLHIFSSQRLIMERYAALAKFILRDN